ncbi:hypothetical protein BDP81DRAFT_12526 [Colletotrichum phormii]|uniref:Secreted protein n=1 Tax=Colletotrichum phormii TaxID=359342 RepID=A0AAJ0A4U7_9PEZI|nr:uncharacterized protein BDP81DRAFT_12526 [Colletotrichum phormii]KAK1655928.1 hypothetical protein BDP81DRAFT_12526 [Colletotrichum phormii]
MGGITTAAVSLSAACLCLATGGVLSVDASLYGIVGHFSFSFIFSFFSSGGRGGCVVEENYVLRKQGRGGFPAREGEMFFFSAREHDISRLGQAHLFFFFLEWTVMISLKSRINEGAERRPRDHSVRPRTRFSHYAALRGNVFWVLLLRRTRHDTPRPWANQQEATFTLHTFSPFFAATVVVLFRDPRWSSGIQGRDNTHRGARGAPVMKKEGMKNDIRVLRIRRGRNVSTNLYDSISACARPLAIIILPPFTVFVPKTTTTRKSGPDELLIFFTTFYTILRCA